MNILQLAKKLSLPLLITTTTKNDVDGERITLFVKLINDVQLDAQFCWLQFHEAALDKHFENLKL